MALIYYQGYIIPLFMRTLYQFVILHYSGYRFGNVYRILL